MASISELNVRLGLLYKDFDASLKKVERNLERSGRKFSQLGNDLALSISLPLAALGASAIKQAGEIESLKLAMTSTFEAAGKSAADATKEVELLRQAAKAPGLDFEQAVKGSIRLQGVGLAAEESRRILEQMANDVVLRLGCHERKRYLLRSMHPVWLTASKATSSVSGVRVLISDRKNEALLTIRAYTPTANY